MKEINIIDLNKAVFNSYEILSNLPKAIAVSGYKQSGIKKLPWKQILEYGIWSALVFGYLEYRLVPDLFTASVVYLEAGASEILEATILAVAIYGGGYLYGSLRKSWKSIFSGAGALKS